MAIEPYLISEACPTTRGIRITGIYKAGWLQGLERNEPSANVEHYDNIVSDFNSQQSESSNTLMSFAR